MFWPFSVATLLGNDSNSGERLRIHFLAVDRGLLFLGEHIGGNAIGDVVSEDDHRAKGCSHEAKSNTA